MALLIFTKNHPDDHNNLFRFQWQEHLALLGAAFEERGAAATLGISAVWPQLDCGIQGRTNLGLDVQLPRSKVDHAAMQAARETTGLDTDTRGEPSFPKAPSVKVTIPEEIRNLSLALRTLTTSASVIESTHQRDIQVGFLVRNAALTDRLISYCDDLFWAGCERWRDASKSNVMESTADTLTWWQLRRRT